MKTKLLLISIFCFITSILYSQNNRGNADDFSRIALCVYMPDNNGIPVTANNLLKNKLTQIASKNGLAAVGYESRFVFTSTVDVISQELTATSPTMYAVTLNINFFVGDGVDGTLFSSTSIQQKGVGQSEEKAYIAALRALNVNNPTFKPMLDKGKNRIIEYYNSKCDFILSSARAAAGRDGYEEGILQLLEVPDVCKDCYDKAMKETEKIYGDYLDRVARIKLEQAKSVWAAGQSADAATEVISIIATIDPKAPCYNEAEQLRQKMYNFIRAQKNQEDLEDLIARIEQLEAEQQQRKEATTVIDDAKQVAAQNANNEEEAHYKTNW